MALDYTELSQDLGKLIKYYNAFATTGQGIATIVDAIQTEFADNQMQAAISGLRPGQQDAWKSEYAGRRSVLAGYAAARLTDRDSVLLEVGAISNGLSEVLSKLIEQFVTDSETVNASSLSIGSVSAHASNIGNGTVLTTALLDRVTSPGSRAGVQFAAHHLYGDLASELGITESMLLRCTADSYRDGVAEGGESFSWEGDLADSTHGVEAAEGSGAIGSVTAIHGDTGRYLANADFETFTVANTPDSWTIVAGTVGTHIRQSTSEFYHALSSLRYTGDGAQANIEVSQAVSGSTITDGKRYCVTCRIKADATIAAGDLTIQFEGTGYTAGGSEKITVTAASLPTSWTLKSFFVLMPLNVPSDFKLVVRWNGTPTNTKNLYIDDFAMGEVAYGAGMGLAVVRGSTPFVRDDRYSFSNTATEGVVQKFFRRVFGVQLPSDSGGGETIADSVAT